MKSTVLSAVCLVLALYQPEPRAADEAAVAGSGEDRLIRMAADEIDAVLGDVASSTEAIARELVTAWRTAEPPTEAQRADWRGRHRARGDVVVFQTWDGDLDQMPDYQADFVALYSYQGVPLENETIRQLQLLERLAPVVRSAYRTFDFSWSYVTTVDGNMLLFPFLTLEEAVHNDSPTEQIYYTRADFEHRSVGWTAPYLDLVGAGMMITASYPAYDGDALRGVVSHDITLAQLSKSVLSRLVSEGDVAWLFTDDGLAIGASAPALARELTEVNGKAGAPVLHYRSPGKLPAGSAATPSATAWINEVTDRIIERSSAQPESALSRVSIDGRRVVSTRSALTGWHVALAQLQ